MPASEMPALILADPPGRSRRCCPLPIQPIPSRCWRPSTTSHRSSSFIWPLPDKGLDRRLYRVHAPTLLIWGAQDGLVHPAYGKAFAAKINGAKLQVFDHAGHLPQLEQPEKVAAAVTAFLT